MRAIAWVVWVAPERGVWIEQAFQCDGVIRRAHVSRSKAEGSRLLHQEDTDGLVEMKRGDEAKQSSSVLAQALGRDGASPPPHFRL